MSDQEQFSLPRTAQCILANVDIMYSGLVCLQSVSDAVFHFLKLR